MAVAESMTDTNNNETRDRLPDTGERVRGQSGEYSLGKVLGDGGYGTVFACHHSGMRLAVKVEKYSKSMLFVEASVLRAANAEKLTHFCTMVDAGSLSKEYIFIVMTLLGKDLHRLRAEQVDRRFSMSTGLRIGMQTLEAIRELHSINFLNRDIKPGNFAPGHKANNQHKTIYMFDFGLARRYVDKKKNIVPSRGEVGWRGTTRYGSLHAHAREDLSRRDDLESWFYLLVEVTRGCLPWRLVTDRLLVCNAKKRIRNEDADTFFQGVPPSFRKILDDIDSLTFEREPNYDKYQKALEEACEENDVNEEDNFDWEEEVSSRRTPNSNTADKSEFSEKKDNEVSRNCLRPNL